VSSAHLAVRRDWYTIILWSNNMIVYSIRICAHLTWSTEFSGCCGWIDMKRYIPNFASFNRRVYQSPIESMLCVLREPIIIARIDNWRSLMMAAPSSTRAVDVYHDGKKRNSEFHSRSSSEMTRCSSFCFPSSPSDSAILFLSFLYSADFGPKRHVLALLTKHW